MITGIWLRKEIPAFAELSDEELLARLKIIEQEKGLLITANVILVWLVIFALTELLAVYLGIELFRAVAGWAVIVGGILLASLGSKANHKRYLKKLLIQRFARA